jgi:hypothetical protein
MGWQVLSQHCWQQVSLQLQLLHTPSLLRTKGRGQNFCEQVAIKESCTQVESAA